MSAQAKCIRCGGELKPGVSFCVGCGFENEGMARSAEMATIDERIENRLNWFRFWQSFSHIFRRR